ncbi:Tn3 family transposase [Paraburkholderia sediminicola]|nr:Tn3 family transposase [Paraburkholderia sediminicola]
MQPSDTAYPRFKNRPSPAELEQSYTPTGHERLFCDGATRSAATRLGFVLLLKTFQRLGYFVTSDQVPDAIIEHVATVTGQRADPAVLRRYDTSEARRKHMIAVRRFLEVKSFDGAGKALLCEALGEAALTKEDVADIINVGIEILVRHRYELPAFGTLVREARARRAATNQTLQRQVHLSLDEVGAAAIDTLFTVGDDPRRVSPWHDLKQDAAKPTVHGMRELLARHDRLVRWAEYTALLHTIPVVKVTQWALEGNSLDAASMADLASPKRYAVALALIRQRLARVTDDLCEILCKQMSRVIHAAEDALQQYLTNSQGKTDEIVRRFASLETLLNSAEPADAQLQAVRKTVTDRPDLCEFSRLHAEYGGKNECRFMAQFFKPRRAELLRILTRLRFVSTSHDTGFERSLALMLSLRERRGEWVALKADTDTHLSLQDLDWVPEKWWKLITGESQRESPARLHRRQFEVCVCAQMIRELKSGDLCVIGADTYSDYREQMVPLEECARTRAAYGDEVDLPVEGDAFVQHVRGLLTDAAKRTDDAYPENAFFKIVNGRPKLGRQTAKTTPAGFEQLDQALTRKLDALGLSLLDVLADTSQWIDWDRHFSPLSGHDSKLREQARRKILTVFAYGTGLGPTQTARNIADISARQISFVDQRQVSTEKLESSLCDIINAYNRFQLPRYWGDPKHAAADGTQWNLYENNLLSERHVRYCGYGGIAYYHVSDVYIALFSHFIPCGVWEAIHILDGLTKNDSDIQPDILHGDTQAQSATVYGLAFLLGIKLMPRIRNWKDLKWFRPAPGDAYQHINSLFTKEAVDWDRIACHLPDMLQVAQSIRAGRISPSTILRKLGTASRKNKLYFAFRELGRVVRTIFLLEYISDEDLRRVTQAAQNKCEGFNKFAQWAYFGSDIIAENVRDDQLKIIKYNHLIANLVIFHNCHTITLALKELESEGMQLTPQLLAAFSPYRTHHLNRFGLFELRDREPAPVDYGIRF